MTSRSDITDRLAASLREARRAQGLSLDAVAKLSGVSRSMVSQIERGESSPTVATLWNLTQALQVDFAGLLDGKPQAGIDVTRAKLTVTLISAAMTCVGGVLYAQYQLYINPETVSGIGISLQMVFAAVVGGIYVALGPTIGAIITIMLAEVLRIAEPGNRVAADFRQRIDLATHYGLFRPGQAFTDALHHGGRGPFGTIGQLVHVRFHPTTAQGFHKAQIRMACQGTGLCGNGLCRVGVVAGQHHGVDAQCVQLGDGGPAAVLDGVRYGE